MIDLQKILVKAQTKVGKVTFIAVDGHGGSGKSTFAKLLSEKLGAEIIHTDDYQVMLNEAMKTEAFAAKCYRDILDCGELDSELYDQIEQIFFAESRSVEEIHLLGIDV